MSELRGVNFTQQRMTPADLGRIFETLFSDGIIQGCAMSYGSATFSVASGYLVAGGKLLCVPSAISRIINQATSGYARLLLTIDLTRTATITSFEQAELTVEYSATSGGFPSLTQSDVNGAGTVYQIVLAVVSLGAAGITGIVEMLQPAAIHGGLPLDENGRVAIKDGGTGAGTAEGGLKALGGVSLKKLWTNASPTRSFPSQKVSLNLSEYNLILVCTGAINAIAVKGMKYHIIDFYWPGAVYEVNRDFIFDNTGVTFDGSLVSTSVSDSNLYLIPQEIYGIKGES